jgi:hypothetical protein
MISSIWSSRRVRIEGLAAGPALFAAGLEREVREAKRRMQRALRSPVRDSSYRE